MQEELSVLFLVAATGAILFSLGNDVWSLVIARGLIGLGVSGALMGAFKAFAVWYPKERLPLLIGIFMSAGGMGAIVASTPLEMALQITDWRGVYLFLLKSSMTSLRRPRQRTGGPTHRLTHAQREIL